MNRKRTSISTIVLDQGRELYQRALEDWARPKGISIDATPAYTPQLNGKAESAVRTLLRDWRAARIQSGILHDFFTQRLIEAAVHIRNLIPRKALGWKAPAEVFGGTEACNSLRNYIRSLGSLVWVWSRQNKLQPRAWPGILVGFGPHGSYYVAPLVNGKVELRIIYTSDICRFDESRYPLFTPIIPKPAPQHDRPPAIIGTAPAPPRTKPHSPPIVIDDDGNDQDDGDGDDYDIRGDNDPDPPVEDAKDGDPPDEPGPPAAPRDRRRAVDLAACAGRGSRDAGNVAGMEAFEDRPAGGGGCR
jgi:hypothetical protein